ncbi:Zn-dependent metalloprotease [Friedmanniella endophytica]|uniref:Neutral metalloproteinase n=1 Tax=Microlunatus kandeliicorticis TaxID=1759536 RepID=A0A7W3IVD8_9ACTN|nr:M4 family metallopeptidase [Microlunatus kandeliicorticis]MBA8795971.1 Zn-dependent metalloprotease [Microlunatus kandeliicorticis]
MTRTPATRRPLACILGPDVLLRLAENASPEDRLRLMRSLALDHSFRSARVERGLRARLAGAAGPAAGSTPGRPNRAIYDQHNSDATTPGTLVRAEGQPAVEDGSVNQAYDNFGFTYALYWDVFQRDSIDGRGQRIEGLVHYGQAYDNAFWDGEGHMFFGDGDGRLLTDTTKGLDVIGHELTHGVTQNTANLTYQDQAGALNESVSDVFGSLVKQYHLQQSAEAADWLIGADIVGPELAPALRSMKAPGTANSQDTQPATMDGYVRTSDDNGGVHTNSGIPNHAFYVIATTIGGNAWEAPGRIWYATLNDPDLQPSATFADFAAVTLKQAKAIFGDTSAEAQGVQSGWEAVKVAPAPGSTA